MTHEQILKPRKALSPAYLKVKPNRIDIERFKNQLIDLLDQSNDKESEEFHKNLISDFLKKTWYDPSHFINTKGRNDLVIHNGNKAGTEVGVIIEAKKPTNKSEMPSKANLNSKAFQELVLYYLRERIIEKNTSVRHLIVTNIYEWFIVDAIHFDRLFAQNKKLVKDFEEFTAGSKADTKTDFFYKSIAEPEFEKVKHQIPFTYFDFRDYEKPLRNTDKEDDAKLIALFKLLSPEHLLKLPFANDSNSLDKKFYSELLHLIGLTETKEGGKKLIGRPKKEDRHPGSLLENAINQLQSLDKLSRLDRPSQYGATEEERLFAVGLELCITWVNRILFLKLLEAQLLSYNKGNKVYNFLSTDKISDFDELNSLFFEVLARKSEERIDEVKTKFAHVPYLNSSLFEPTEMEHNTLLIANLKNERKLPILSSSVLKDANGKKLSGELNALEYFFRFLDSYDFSSEGSEEIQEENKTLINASVLGLIFEKINGYKDGSFFTPGFITMYMCRETIRRAVVQKFADALKTLTPNPSPLRRGELPKVELQGQKINPELLENAREMRKNQTSAEEFLWNLLRNRRFLGYKFRRQHPVAQKYILDFFCDELRLGLELDGEYHASSDQKEYDEGRTYELEEFGIKIIRFSNDEVLWETEKVLDTIRQFAVSPSPLSFGRGAGGEGVKEDLELENFDDLYDLIGPGGQFSYNEANTLINSLKICDPAVGSGHFLVSALNEIIAVKNDLRVLQDRSGKRLKEYGVSVVNDELVVTDEDGELYEYNPNNPESQRIQETLFHEKQTIIENCLFGVDINPNSVKICRLRLWIELLKSAYYKRSDLPGFENLAGLRELETLPNIDINIKCGNSLVSRFALDADLSQALKKSKFSIDAYRIAVDTYRNAENKTEKREMERLIEAIKSDFRSEITKNDPKIKRKNAMAGELYNLTMQTGLFEESATEKKKRQARIEKFEDELNKLETEIEEIKANKIFENAFEWRFEFPEVLNQEGDFVGFDVVIGNPPYISNWDLSESNRNLVIFLEKEYKPYLNGHWDLFGCFVVKGYNILKQHGMNSYILPTSFYKEKHSTELRRFFLENVKIEELIDFQEAVVFEDVARQTGVYQIQKTIPLKNQIRIKNSIYDKGQDVNQEFYKSLKNLAFKTKVNSVDVDLYKKITNNVNFLGELVCINTGVVAHSKVGSPKKFTKDDVIYKNDLGGFKKYVIGSNLSPYRIKFENDFIDYTSNSENFHRAKFPLLFESEKIIVRRISGKNNKIIACYDDSGYYSNDNLMHLVKWSDEILNYQKPEHKWEIIKDSEISLKSIIAIINSKFTTYFFSKFLSTDTLQGSYSSIYPEDLRQLPIIHKIKINYEIDRLVDEILFQLSKDIDSNISNIEGQIDALVYELYGLTEEEISIVEGGEG